jgi:hypothetical protein
MGSNVISLPGARAVPEEARALFLLLTAISSRDLRRYCLDQLGAANSAEEVDAAMELTRAIARASVRSARAGAELAAAIPPTDLGASAPVKLRRAGAGKRKAACIAGSSSP